ncbi:hypothetical protein niasHT_017774 [Heterodera trifolii]|uniref:Uncharacterized protein n=1 Tax=Heterodera trifolii TaxID=157864 RepID=A0ABD2LJF1_9BILA
MSNEFQRMMDDDGEDEQQHTNGTQTIGYGSGWTQNTVHQAVICEIQRMANLVAFNMPSKLIVSRIVTIDGHLLKAGTMVCQ